MTDIMVQGRSLLIIGGTGFFGKSFLSAFHRDLLAAWEVRKVTIVARQTADFAQKFGHLLSADVTLLDADVTVAEHLPHADYVIHAAASTDARRYIEFAVEERKNIESGIANFCRVARKDLVDSKILFTSSGAVYGQQPTTIDLITEEFIPAHVDELVSYKRDYAEAKLISENAVRDLGNDNIRTTIARCFAFVGEYLPRDQHFAVGNFIADGLAGRSITVKAERPVYRSYMHADDMVRWLMTMVDHASLDGPCYNLGSDEAVTIGDLAHIVAAKLGVSANIPIWTSAMVDRYVPSVAKAELRLSLRRQFVLDDALDDVIARIKRSSTGSTV